MVEKIINIKEKKLYTYATNDVSYYATYWKSSVTKQTWLHLY